jgi:hypothetical protein
MRLKNKTCYMCDAPAVTREHAPPLSFFPEGGKPNLITVPSCWTHNNDNSGYVEYVRNVVASCAEVNGVGLEIFKTKGVKSLNLNAKLFRKTLGKARPILHKGEQTVRFTVDLIPFKRIMRAIANAVFYKDFGHRYPNPQKWWIYGATLNTEAEYWGMPDRANARMKDSISTLAVTDRNTGMPEVFQYAIYQESEEKTIYKLVFYEGVVVCAISYT